MLGNGLCKLMQWVPQPMLEEYNANGDRKVVGYDDQSQDRFMQLERQLEEQQRGGGVKIGAGLNANDDDRPLPPPPPPRRLAAASTAGQFKCEFEGCGKICFDRASLKKHMQIHGARQYVCTYEGCGKKFQDSSKLKRHFLTHTGEKNHVCTICNKAFSLDFNLKTHMRIHTGDKRECPVVGCTKKFIHAYKLKSHLNTHGDLSLLELKENIGMDGFPSAEGAAATVAKSADKSKGTVKASETTGSDDAATGTAASSPPETEAVVPPPEDVPFCPVAE